MDMAHTSKRKEVPLPWSLMTHDHGKEEHASIHIDVNDAPMLLLFYLYTYYYGLKVSVSRNDHGSLYPMCGWWVEN